MPRSLYFEKHKMIVGRIGEEPHVEFMTTYGIKPRKPQQPELTRHISLKDDLKWREVQNLQKVMSGADFWSEFPEPGLRLITAEVKAGTEPQRIDLLYLRTDGGVLPCELKVGGTELDTHGQLIRYISDLSAQPISKDWVISRRREYLDRKYHDNDKREQNVRIDLFKFEEQIEAVSEFRLVSKTGIMMDEGFPSALVTAVRFLNRECALAIRLIQLDAFVTDDWTLDAEEYVMRLDLNEIPSA
jgi:hypothetical protein